MKLRITTLFIILSSLLSLASCSEEQHKCNVNSNDSTIFTLLLEGGEYTYRFTLYDDNTLKVKNESIELSEADVNNIMEQVEAIYKNHDIHSDSNEYAVTDAWEVTFSYKDKEVKQVCIESMSDEIEKLYETLIDLSPIGVDMQGFA